MPLSELQADTAYSSFHNLLQQSENLMGGVLVGNLQDALVEVFPYFASSFGSVRCRAFGVYHETNFVAWLYCLAKIGVIIQQDYQFIVSKVFIRYRETIAKLRTIFRPFPAVSIEIFKPIHDEFLPYLFGSSELIGEDPNGPAIIRSRDAVMGRHKRYLSFQLVMEKTSWEKFELLEIHLTMSRMESWSSVKQILLELYQEQFQGITALKNFRFGSLIEWQVMDDDDDVGDPDPLDDDDDDDVGDPDPLDDDDDDDDVEDKDEGEGEGNVDDSEGVPPLEKPQYLTRNLQNLQIQMTKLMRILRSDKILIQWGWP
ncbi:uncharacterized protein LOC131250717 [Magnolia sinica]|uniref:uncharacterized protein LOC131250717 n=1 Tax=Magnolia sinica TaxID=86752 RepID=UPI0026597283|nr:uncharacterized protein LOC131250717 [Magnolia sinica]